MIIGCLFYARPIHSAGKRGKQGLLLAGCWKASGMTFLQITQSFSEVLLNTVDIALAEVDMDPSVKSFCSSGKD